MKACEGECLVTGCTDPVLGLPQPAALNTDARADQVVHRMSEEMLWRGWRSPTSFYGAPEKKLELGPMGAKLSSGGEGQIYLQVPREQEYSVHRRLIGKIEQVNRVELALKTCCPVGQDICHSRIVSQAKREI